VIADNGEQDIAGLDGSLDGFGEVDTWFQRIDIHKDLADAEPLNQPVRQAPSDVGAILTSVAHEDSTFARVHAHRPTEPASGSPQIQSRQADLAEASTGDLLYNSEVTIYRTEPTLTSRKIEREHRSLGPAVGVTFRLDSPDQIIADVVNRTGRTYAVRPRVILRDGRWAGFADDRTRSSRMDPFAAVQ
jgi:hypothetical protein